MVEMCAFQCGFRHPLFSFAHIVEAVTEGAQCLSLKSYNTLYFSPESETWIDFAATALEQNVHKEQEKARENRTGKNTHRQKDECEGKECIKGMERDNRITTTAMPDHIVTLCLITLRDIRSSMKLVQHVQYNNHQYHNATRAHTYSKYDC